MSQSPSKTFRKIVVKRNTAERSSKNRTIAPIVGITRYGVGMDVHRDTVVTCICAQTAQNEIVTVQMHTFRNTPVGLREMVAFLGKFHPLRHTSMFYQSESLLNKFNYLTF